MMKRLIILSDLWGKKKATWLTNYTELLENDFEIVFYDSCELAEINTTIYTEENLHQQFVNGGIEKAISKLCEIEKQNDTILLAFSMGGTIAWNFAMKSNRKLLMYCISSTRLRYESKKPSGNIFLYFSENDKFVPKDTWFKIMNLSIIKVKGNHDIYRDKNFATFVCEEIIKNKISYSKK